MVAVQNGHIDIVKLLVDAGANAHVENKVSE
jgi:ankyrin repeat protein